MNPITHALHFHFVIFDIIYISHYARAWTKQDHRQESGLIGRAGEDDKTKKNTKLTNFDPHATFSENLCFMRNNMV